MFKTLLTAAILLAIALPVDAQVGPGCGPTDGNCGTGGRRPASGRVCTRDARGRLSMRTGAGRNYGKILEIPNRTYITLSAGGYDSNGIYWWRTYYNGRSGWVRSDYVCGDPQ